MLKTNKKVSKLISFALATSVAIASFSALAMENKIEKTSQNKNLMTGEKGLSSISNPTYTADPNDYWIGEYVYYGVDGAEPIKWNILSKDETNYGGDSLFLLKYGTISPIGIGIKYGDSTDYQTSNLKTVLNNNYTNYFSNYEKNGIINSNKIEMPDTLVPINSTSPPVSPFKNPILQNEKLFPLSMEEATNNKYGFGAEFEDSSRIAEFNSSSNMSWLTRSSFGNMIGSLTSSVYYDIGNPIPTHVTTNIGSQPFQYTGYSARPAMNLDKSKILLVSSADNGKNSVENGNLTEVNQYTGNEYKLTIKDDNQHLTIDNATKNGNVVNLNYNAVGNGDYLSTVIEDSEGNILYYGRVKDISTEKSGQATINIPNVTQPYKIKMFTEKYNGDKKTDFASSFIDLSIGYNITIDTNIVNGVVTTNKSVANFGDIITTTYTANEGYQLIDGSLKVMTRESGIEITPTNVTKATNGSYTFEMPPENATVFAQFELIPVVNPPVVEPENPTPPTEEVKPETGKNPTTGTTGVVGLAGVIAIAAATTRLTKKRKNKQY